MAGVRHHEDLVAWQLSEKLRQAVLAILAKPTVARHRTFCDQIERSTRSAPSNIAEGFSRKPREFARYMRIALGSLGETQNHLRAALNDKMITAEDFDNAWSLSVRAIKASKKLHSHLRNCPNRN